MRANIKIIGIGARRSGTSNKTGRGYDFTPISIAFSDPNMAGSRAETVNVNTGDLPAGFALDETFDAVMHYANNRLYIDAIL